MNKPYELIPSPQKYQTMKEIRMNYGKKYVLAHSCKVENGIVLGGCVFATSTEEGKGFKEIRILQKQIREKRSDLEPIYRFCLDKNLGDIKINNEMLSDDTEEIESFKEKENPILKAIQNLPDEIFVQALKTMTINDE